MDEGSDGHDGDRGVVELALNFVLQWDLDRYIELFDASAVMESPFAPPGVSGTDGRQSIDPTSARTALETGE